MIRMADIPAEGSTMILPGGTVLTAEHDKDWCRVECTTWSHYAQAECGYRCNLPGHHDEHECVDGHTLRGRAS